jgi:hypothetical protein
MRSPLIEGKTAALFEAYDVNDQLTARSICIENTGGIALTRHCFYVDSRVETEEMFDTAENTWHDLSSRPYAGGVPSMPGSTGSIPDNGPTYTAVKEWDTPTNNGTFIHRSLYAGSDRSMRLFATERDSSGNRVTSSTCDFTQSWSDCINQSGQHYQLKPNSITYFYSLLTR